MIEVVKLTAEHLEQLLDQPGSAHLKAFVTPEHVKNLASANYSYAMVTATGRVVCCAGVAEYWSNRGEGWALFDSRCKKEFLSIHNAVKRFLAICPLKRIEAAVDVSFEAGHRWARSLGFTMEAACMKSYKPEGGDCALYARVVG